VAIWSGEMSRGGRSTDGAGGGRVHVHDPAARGHQLPGKRRGVAVGENQARVGILEDVFDPRRGIRRIDGYVDLAGLQHPEQRRHQGGGPPEDQGDPPLAGAAGDEDLLCDAIRLTVEVAVGDFAGIRIQSGAGREAPRLLLETRTDGLLDPALGKLAETQRVVAVFCCSQRVSGHRARPSRRSTAAQITFAVGATATRKSAGSCAQIESSSS